VARPSQPWLVRVTHWVNVPALAIMAMTGLQILVAYPYLGPVGGHYGWYPFAGTPPAPWMRMGQWLAGARHWHFAMAWLFAINGLVYLAYLFVRGEWRDRLFLPARDTRNALETVAFYLRIRKLAPAQGFYNGLQRIGYTSAALLGVVMVLSGLALYKPVQLHWLAALFGGYDSARAVHLLGLVFLAAFVVGHVVVAVHWRTLASMITGGPARE
jgi:thiosulfate reductase cytochrome b subunit